MINLYKLKYKNNETKSWSFEKINKINKSLAGQTKKKREKTQINKIRDEIHKKIMKALIQVYGEEEANKINEEWIGCSSEIEIENEIVIFKEALYLGYDLADVFFNRR